MGRRVAALLIDWLIAYGLALLALGFGVITEETLSTAVLVDLVAARPGVRCGCLVSRPASSRWDSGWSRWTAVPVGIGRVAVRGVC